MLLHARAVAALRALERVELGWLAPRSSTPHPLKIEPSGWCRFRATREFEVIAEILQTWGVFAAVGRHFSLMFSAVKGFRKSSWSLAGNFAHA